MTQPFGLLTSKKRRRAPDKGRERNQPPNEVVEKQGDGGSMKTFEGESW